MLLRSVLSRSLVCASLSLLLGCSRQAEIPLPANARLVTLPLQDVAGLSGLARDDGGSLFAVPELDRVLVEMSAAGALLAVERHFSVSRLLVFTLPAHAAADEVPRQAQVVLDLVPYANGGKRNFEGAVWIDDRHAMLVVDNKYGTVTGPNEIIEVARYRIREDRATRARFSA